LPDGERADPKSAAKRRAVVGSGKGLLLLDLTTGKETARLEGDRDVVSLAIAADGKRLLYGGDDHTLRLWDIQNRRELCSFQGHAGPVKAVAFAPDGKRIASGSNDGTVRLWDIESGKELGKFTQHADGVVCVSFTADGGHTISGSRDSQIRYWNLEKVLNRGE
jgi:WD40 repeat protein